MPAAFSFLSEENFFKRGIFFSLIGLAFSLAWSRTGISFFFSLTLLFWLFEGNWKQKKTVFQDKFVLALFVFLGFMILSILWTNDYLQAWKNIRNYGHLLLIPVVLTSFDLQKSRYLIYAFIAGFLLHLGASYLGYYRILPIKHPMNPHVFMHHLDYSMFLAFVGIFLLNRFYRREYTSGEKTFYLVLALLTVVMLFIVRGRSGQFAFFATLPFVLLFAVPANRRLWGAVTGIAVIGFLFTLAFFLSSNFKKRTLKTLNSLEKIINDSDYNSSIGKRVFVGKITLQILQEHPLFGTGIGDNLAALREKAESQASPELLAGMKNILRTHFHNQYFQILAETGIAGLLLYFTFWGFFLRKAKIDREYGALSVFLALLFFAGFVGEPFAENQFTSALLAFFLAFLNRHNIALN